MQPAAAHQAPVFFQVRSGCAFEPPIGQEWTRSRMDSPLLPVADNASVVQAVSLYDHQSFTGALSSKRFNIAALRGR